MGPNLQGKVVSALICTKYMKTKVKVRSDMFYSYFSCGYPVL